MKRIYTFLLIAAMLPASIGLAQINSPRPSPTATITQTVGITDIEINYSRPGVKDRKIFGDLVPYGEMWRTGANSSTKIKFEDQINLGGQDIPAGEYAIYTIPGETEWTVIIYKDLKMGGAVANYKDEDDQARFTVPSRQTKDMVESFTIDFSSFTDNGATMTLSWENTAVDIPIKVDTDTKVMAQIQEQLIEGKAEDPGAGTYAAAASFYHKKGKDLDQALVWMNKAIEKRPEAFWYVHRKAELLGDMGEKEAAIDAAKKSIEMAKANEEGDFGYVERNEKLIAKLSAK